MTSAADLDRLRIIGVNLPAFLLSKNVCPDPVRAPRHYAEAVLQIFSFEALENKKPGVERRAKSRFNRGFARSSTYF
jgi:hypothetical protein